MLSCLCVIETLFFHSRYENHSPSTTHTGNNGTNSNSERDDTDDIDKSKERESKGEGNEVGESFNSDLNYFFLFLCCIFGVSEFLWELPDPASSERTGRNFMQHL